EVLLHSSGKPFSRDIPCPVGPRNPGQFSAVSSRFIPKSNNGVNKAATRIWVSFLFWGREGNGKTVASRPNRSVAQPWSQADWNQNVRNYNRRAGIRIIPVEAGEASARLIPLAYSPAPSRHKSVAHPKLREPFDNPIQVEVG
ncbi:MAG: hypothetical protein L0312_16820, partial [Acidobacteria bacterium]|nr:hypothetical protein [Acidobacteriota bacterium]